MDRVFYVGLYAIPALGLTGIALAVLALARVI